MNKKGFTLVELLAVIIILAIIATISVPSTLNVINYTKEKACEEQVKMIEDAAKRWASDNPMDSRSYIEITTLQSEGYLDKSEKLLNPKTRGEMKGIVNIYKDEVYNQYTYEYDEDPYPCEE